MSLIKYFISPDGEIIPVGDRHIITVYTYPEKFNVTKDWINETYKKHNERIGTEQKARAEILRKLFRDGFIRVRYYGSNDKWMFQVHELNGKNQDLIRTFIHKALHDGINGRKSYPHTEVVVIDSKDITFLESSIGDITSKGIII